MAVQINILFRETKLNDQLAIAGMQTGEQGQHSQTISGSGEESEGDFGTPADGSSNWAKEVTQMAFPFYNI